LPAFTKFADASRIEGRLAGKADEYTGALMPVTGELIRAMNYVEDITNTLRRICLYIPNMNTEERQRLTESLRTTVGAINAAIADLEKVGP
jgi:hypothetical protein